MSRLSLHGNPIKSLNIKSSSSFYSPLVSRIAPADVPAAPLVDGDVPPAFRQPLNLYPADVPAAPGQFYIDMNGLVVVRPSLLLVE